jgi:hypothetical protein
MYRNFNDLKKEIMTAKEYLQGNHEWHKKHWNEHEHIDDNWWANEMEEYHQAKLKLLDIPLVSKCLPLDVTIKTAETESGIEFSQYEYDEWLKSKFNTLDEYLESIA